MKDTIENHIVRLEQEMKEEPDKAKALTAALGLSSLIMAKKAQEAAKKQDTSKAVSAAVYAARAAADYVLFSRKS